VLASHRLASSRDSRSARRAAAVKFTEQIHRELNGLYPHPVNWPKDDHAIHHILSAAFPALQTAVAEFRPFIPWWKRWLFDRAWFRYRNSSGRKQDTQVYHHYMAFDDNPNAKAIFHANVSRLLHFANET